MAGVPDDFRERLARLPAAFSLDQVRATGPGLTDSSIKVYLSQLVSAGELRRIGPALFERAQANRPGPVEDRALRPVIQRLRGALLPGAFHRVVAWSDESLAPFVHDALVEPFVVVEAPNAVIDTITQALLHDWALRSAKWRTRLGTMLWDRPRSVHGRPDVFLVPNSSLDGTRPAPGGIRIPRLERLLSDVLAFKPLFPDTPLRMLESPGFDVHEALRLAGRRGNTAQVASFLTWAALQPHRRRLLEELQVEFPHLAAEADR